MDLIHLLLHFYIDQETDFCSFREICIGWIALKFTSVDVYVLSGSFAISLAITEQFFSSAIIISVYQFCKTKYIHNDIPSITCTLCLC